MATLKWRATLSARLSSSTSTNNYTSGHIASMAIYNVILSGSWLQTKVDGSNANGSAGGKTSLMKMQITVRKAGKRSKGVEVRLMQA